MEQGQTAVLTRDGLDALIAALASAGYRVCGPTVRDGAIVYDDIAGTRDLPEGWIDYDRRQRNPALERERGAALAALASTAARLAALGERASDPELYVRQDGSGWSHSSLVRELGVLHSHAIHHYSLVALLLRECGADVPEDLGVAPATLAYRSGRAGRSAPGH